MKKKIVIILIATVLALSVVGCSSSLVSSGEETETVSESETSESSTSTSSSSEEASTSESSSGDSQEDLFAQIDKEKEEAERKQREAEARAQQQAQEELEKDPQNQAMKALQKVTNAEEFVDLIRKEHDNAKYGFGTAESLENYVGKLDLSKVACCVSDDNGLEKVADYNKLLNMKIVQKEFIHLPQQAEKTHEFFDADGNLLFTIEELDYIGGLSTGKYRVKTPKAEAPITYYDDDVNIGLIEEYEQWDNIKQENVGARTHFETEEEIQKNIDKNNMETEPVTLKDIIGKKYNNIKTVSVYAPDYDGTNEKGYVNIPISSSYIQKILNNKYFEKRHTYKLSNERNYIVFKDENGKQVFTLNNGSVTEGIDLSYQKKSIKKGYNSGKITELYPADTDINAAIQSEEELVVKLNEAFKTAGSEAGVADIATQIAQIGKTTPTSTAEPEKGGQESPVPEKTEESSGTSDVESTTQETSSDTKM